MISKDQITHLRISLSSNPLSWITEFIKQEGIGLLSSLLASDKSAKSRERYYHTRYDSE